MQPAGPWPPQLWQAECLTMYVNAPSLPDKMEINPNSKGYGGIQ